MSKYNRPFTFRPNSGFSGCDLREQNIQCELSPDGQVMRSTADISGDVPSFRRLPQGGVSGVVSVDIKDAAEATDFPNISDAERTDLRMTEIEHFLEPILFNHHVARVHDLYSPGSNTTLRRTNA
jgi:hypothetical protein